MGEKQQSSTNRIQLPLSSDQEALHRLQTLSYSLRYLLCPV